MNFVKLHCDNKTFYKNENALKTFDTIFSHESVKMNTSNEQNGKSYSTCGMNSDIILKMPGLQNLIQWISFNILEYSYLFTEKNVSKIEYKRVWTNKIFEGCYGNWHTHDYFEGVVSIFYFQVPENSSKLLVENDEIEVKTGNLILHHSKLPHAVSKHMSEEPRICIVFESIYI